MQPIIDASFRDVVHSDAKKEVWRETSEASRVGDGDTSMEIAVNSMPRNVNDWKGLDLDFRKQGRVPNSKAIETISVDWALEISLEQAKSGLSSR